MNTDATATSGKPKRIISFIASRKKYLIYSLLMAIVFFVFFEYLSRNWTFVFTRKDQICLPYKFWVIKKGKMPQRGGYVAFRSHNVPWFADGVKWVKILAGVPDDKIETVKVNSGQSGKTSGDYDYVDLNGTPVFLKVRGRVYLRTKDGKLIHDPLNVYETDTKGRRLTIVESQVIPKGKYFVMGSAKRSYDSRYWGLIDETWIFGEAHPVF